MKRNMFLGRLVSAVLLVSLLAGCAGTGETPQSQTSSSQPEESSSSSSSSQSQQLPGRSEEEIAPTGGAEPVMDAAFHRGTIAEIGTAGQVTTYTLMGAPGSGYGALTVTFDQNTRMDFDPAQLQVGDQVELYYSGLSCALEEDVPYVAAISAAKLLPEESTNYNGVVVEVRPGDKEGEGSLVMRALDAAQTGDPGEDALEQFVFHYAPQTQWRLGLSVEELQPGDELNIYHRGVATMSIPPQGSALEIRRMAPLEGELDEGVPLSSQSSQSSAQ